MKKIKELTSKIPNIYKTFAWNMFYQIAAFSFRYLAENLSGLNIPIEYATTLGLILSAISKYLANKKK